MQIKPQILIESNICSADDDRFEFGKNWSRFLEVLNENRIQTAEATLKQMLKVSTLRGWSFVDIGSGSGLFSLAAWRLGARVHSFDYDKRSVACARELHRRYCDNADPNWKIEQGSILDEAYVGSLGKFDVVYSWGVLHHTGAMWKAIEQAIRLMSPTGRLFIAIYADQGRSSVRWKKIKRLYNRLPNVLKPLILWPAFLRLWGPTTIRDCLAGKPFQTWRSYGRNRGMSPWHDVVDWVGGYPFEVAKPEEVFEFCRDRGLTLITLTTVESCNEFVFAKSESSDRI